MIKHISNLTRLPNTKDGNPRYHVNFTDGTSANTAPDAQIASMIANSEFEGVPVKFQFDRNGDIVTATPATEGASS